MFLKDTLFNSPHSPQHAVINRTPSTIIPHRHVTAMNSFFNTANIS
jgi:hypothetical protein